MRENRKSPFSTLPNQRIMALETDDHLFNFKIQQPSNGSAQGRSEPAEAPAADTGGGL
jgi:hypothetical protein